MRTSLARSLLAAASLSIASLACAAPQPQWTVIEIPALGTFGGFANSVNDAGDVVGYSWVNSANANHAFLWNSGTMTDLGTPPGSRSSSAVAVNDHGVVLGIDANNKAWTWSDGTWTSLGGAPSPGDINKSGAMTGMYTAVHGLHGYLYDNGVVTDTGDLGGNNTYTAAINDKNMIVGNSEMPDTVTAHAFMFDGVIHDLGTLGGRNSTAIGVNSHGDVVGGAADSAQVYKPFIWDARGGMRQLFAVSGFGYANDINDHGAVVGLANSRAFLYDRGVVTDLQSIPEVAARGYSQLTPIDINNRGWILAYAFRGTFVSVLLIPN